jgi:hypothetical protein
MSEPTGPTGAEPLQEDPQRAGFPETGVYVRAKTVEGGWGSVDMTRLTRASLLQWLKGRSREYVLDCLLILLEHARLTDEERGS